MNVLLADKYTCTGCMACVDVCPQTAIKRIVDADGHCYVRIDDYRCIGCGKCERLCKTIHNEKANDTALSTPYASWANKKRFREGGTSGGVFAALAEAFITRGGVVVGSLFEDFSARHILISKIEDIPKLQGSKYVQSNTEGVYNEISKQLSNNKVLFFGLGCQVAAVKAFLSHHPNNSNLYTVDMVCGGVPSSHLINKFREQHPDLEKIISFRNKRKYELRGIVNGQEKVFYGKTLPLTGFQVGMTYRYSCNNCIFAKIHRRSDLTIGDLWGQQLFEKDDYNKGVSLVISHGEKGNNLLNVSDVFLKKIEWKDCLPYNTRIYNGKRHYGILRNQLDVFSQKFTDIKFHKIYTFDLKPIDGFWYFYMKYWLIKKWLMKKITQQRGYGKVTF